MSLRVRIALATTVALAVVAALVGGWAVVGQTDAPTGAAAEAPVSSRS